MSRNYYNNVSEEGQSQRVSIGQCRSNGADIDPAELTAATCATSPANGSGGVESDLRALHLTLLRLAMASGGLDRNLDQQIIELQQKVRVGDSPAIEQVVERIAISLTQLLTSRTALQKDLKQPLIRLLRLLETLPLSEEIKQHRHALVSKLEEGLADPSLCNDIIILAEAGLNHLARPGLLKRLFGSDKPDSTPHAATTAVSGQPTEIPPRARLALLMLLDRLILPESFEEAVEQLRARLSAPLPVSELAEVVESILIVIIEATRKEDEQLERFLRQLTNRLVDLENFLDSSRATAQSAQTASNELKQSIECHIREIRTSVSGARSIVQLRQSVEIHLDQILARTARYLRDQELRYRDAEARVRLLQEQLHETEEQTGELRLSLLQHQVRALLDPLTQIANREAYNQRLIYEYNRWRRQHTPLSLLLADVDRFKQVNDCFGHGQGDRVLQTIAWLLQDNLRRTDLVARYGGEEFVILMPETGLEMAEQVAEKLRQIIEGHPFEAGDQQIAVTLSFGLTEFVVGDNPETAFERADRVLYTAKHQGRNRVMIANACDPHAERR